MPKPCPLCGGEPRYNQRDPSHDACNVECDTCGRFRITEQALCVLKDDQKPLLSAYLRRIPRHAEPPVILSDNIQTLVNSLPKYTPREKLENLLRIMAEKTPALGEYSRFNLDCDYPLVHARSSSEANILLTELLNRGFINATRGGFALTLGGWERLESLEKSGRNSTRAFVAMWFDSQMDKVYSAAIKPAIESAGYDPLRIDQHEHVNRIETRSLLKSGNPDSWLQT